MAVKTLNPYLGFDGTAAKAIAFYEKALGAKVEHVMRWGEAPAEMGIPPEGRDQIMHAELTIGGWKLMAADTPAHTPSHAPSPAESNVTVCLQLDDVADLKRKFAALSAGGEVTAPVHEAFWGDTFGMLKDAYGIRWMFVGPKGG